MFQYKYKRKIRAILHKFNHPALVLWKTSEALVLLKGFSALNVNLESKIILEIGYGDGKFSSIVIPQNNFIGLDISKDIIMEAKRNVKENLGLIVSDARYLPFRSSSINIILSICTLEHIPELNKVLKECSIILKNGGLFIFTVPSNYFSRNLFFYNLAKHLHLNNIAKWYSNYRNRQLNHFHCYSIKLWKRILRLHKFKAIFYEYYLSKFLTEIWDLLAFIHYILKKFSLLINLRLMSSNKLRIPYLESFYYYILKRFWTTRERTGSGLIIFAMKNE